MGKTSFVFHQGLFIKTLFSVEISDERVCQRREDALL